MRNRKLKRKGRKADIAMNEATERERERETDRETKTD
jgi:hypothetical protein